MTIAKRNRRVMPREQPIISKCERIIAIPSNNSPNFSYSNNVIRFQIPSMAGKMISPFKVPRLTFKIAIQFTGEALPQFSVSPFLSAQSILYQIQVSSTLKGVVLHTCRFYTRAVQTTELDNYGFEEINRGVISNECKTAYDYSMVATALGSHAQIPLQVADNVSVPLFTNVLDAPDLTGMDLAQLGGLSLEIQLNSNTSVIIDPTNSGIEYSIFDVKLHYDLLSVMPGTPGMKEILFRCIETRADNIQSNSEYKSVSINNSNVESIQVDAVPSSVQNSYAGDSFANNRMTRFVAVTDGVAGNYITNNQTLADASGYVGVSEFRESINGLSLPIQQILNIPNLAPPALNVSSVGLSNILREDYKASVKSASYEHPKTLRNLYTYDNYRFIQAIGTGVNPNPYLTNGGGVARAYRNGVIPIPKFQLGFLNKAGGSLLPESVISYKVVEQVQSSQPMTIFHHLGLIKRLMIGADNSIQVLN